MAFQERKRRDATEAPHSSRSFSVYFIAAVASIGGLLFGYDTGVISGALLFLRQDFGLNATTQEIAVSAGIIFARNSANIGSLTLIAFIIYIVAFALSFGPVFWLMSAEIFPTRVRAIGASISSFANWTANLLVSITFLSLIGALGTPATFWLYAFFGVLAFLFSWLLVPETKGRSLEQIERYWENGRHWDMAA